MTESKPNEDQDFDKEDQDFDKAVGQLRFALNQVLKPLRLYGQDHYVDTATDELISLALQLHFRLSGVDEPFGVDTPYHVNTDKLHY